MNDTIDDDRQEEVYDYFRTSESDSISEALEELGVDDYVEDEVRLMRLKFISDLGN